jgi:glycerol kinase
MCAVLAIDQGTSATKALVVGHSGSILANTRAQVASLPGRGGAVETDPETLWGSVLEAGTTALRQAGRPVDAVALANQGESVLAWDRRTGQPLSRVIGWQDRRAEEVCQQMAGCAPMIRERTGLALSTYFSAPKMAWLRAQDLAYTAENVVITTTDTWLLRRLTGRYVTDVATASRSLLLDLDTGEWGKDLADLFGLDAAVLPEVVANDAVIGTTTAFGREIPVAGVVLDQPAALLAQRCLTAGQAKCTYGTGAFVLANTGMDPVHGGQLPGSIAWRVRGSTTYCVDGQAYAAGALVTWLQRLGLVRSGEDLDVHAAPDSGGVVFVPALAGLGAPWWDSQATASITGLTLETTRGHLLTAALQGLAVHVAELLAALGTARPDPLAALLVDGGLTRSKNLMQAQADIAQIPVQVYRGSNATALGAAALARMAIDPHLSPADAIIPHTPGRTYHPVWSAGQAEDLRERWRTQMRC